MAKIRIKCPLCGAVSNVSIGGKMCPSCKGPVVVNLNSCIYVYRQGSPYSIASNFSLYINGESYGGIANKETLCIPLPHGVYTVHCAMRMNRECKDLTVRLNSEHSVGYTKVYIIPKFGMNSFAVEAIEPSTIAGELITEIEDAAPKTAEVAKSIAVSACKCAKCGYEIPEDAKFCLECGAKVEHSDKRFCTFCGKTVPRGKFCIECGHKF